MKCKKKCKADQAKKRGIAREGACLKDEELVNPTPGRTCELLNCRDCKLTAKGRCPKRFTVEGECPNNSKRIPSDRTQCSCPVDSFNKIFAESDYSSFAGNSTDYNGNNYEDDDYEGDDYDGDDYDGDDYEEDNFQGDQEGVDYEGI